MNVIGRDRVFEWDKIDMSANHSPISCRLFSPSFPFSPFLPLFRGHRIVKKEKVPLGLTCS